MSTTISERLVGSVMHQGSVDDAPHNFYRYPARFSPHFARSAIQEFTQRGDVVLDPFCGGGTTVVEALASGRRAIGCDLNALGLFLTRVKTSPLSRRDRIVIEKWIDDSQACRFCGSASPETHDPLHYARHLPENVSTFFAGILAKIGELPLERQREFARLALLSTGQSFLDCKSQLPETKELQATFFKRLSLNLESHEHFLDATARALGERRNKLNLRRHLIHASSEELGELLPAKWRPVKLVLTSPPYPGVHVLYHRWQINGRRETPAAYWLANELDGAGEAFYTLGRRNEPELKTYFYRLTKVFTAVRTVIDPNGFVVQLVAFSNPSWQLPAFLRAMEAGGFVEEPQSCSTHALDDSRLWREVPGRKWYANAKGRIGASREVLLIHRPA